MVTPEAGHGQTPPRRRLPAAERREAILRAAAEVFAQAGYRAARMSDVAARTGVTEPVVFQNFGSKAALFAAVVERAAAELSAWLEQAGPADGLLAHVLSGHPPGQRDQHAAGTAPAHDGAAYGVLFADAADLADDPELAGPARDAVRAVAAHLADLVRRAQAGGHRIGVRADADPEAAAWLLLSVLSARRLRAAVMPAGLEPAVTALILDGLAPSANCADPASAPGAAPSHDLPDTA